MWDSEGAGNADGGTALAALAVIRGFLDAFDLPKATTVIDRVSDEACKRVPTTRTDCKLAWPEESSQDWKP